MKAIVVEQFGGPEVLELKDVPDPSPGASEALIEVKAAGVNPVDTYVRAGDYGASRSLPWTPGIEGAGVVSTIGADVTEWSVGDRVAFGGFGATRFEGGYAERVVRPAHACFALPDAFSFEQGCLFVTYGTAWRSLFDRGEALPGDVVVVNGATGGVGLAAVQLAASRGCVVVGTGGSESGRELVKQHGATHVLNHYDDGHLDPLPDITGGRKADVIIEMLADQNLDADLRALAQGGRVVIVGNRGRTEVDARAIMGIEGDVRGVMLWGGGDDAVRRAILGTLALATGGRVDPVVDQRRFSLADAPAAHEAVMAGSSRGKIVLGP